MLAKLNGRNGRSRRRLPSGALMRLSPQPPVLLPAPQARRASKGFRDRTLSVRPYANTGDPFGLSRPAMCGSPG